MPNLHSTQALREAAAAGDLDAIFRHGQKVGLLRAAGSTLRLQTDGAMAADIIHAIPIVSLADFTTKR